MVLLYPMRSFIHADVLTISVLHEGNSYLVLHEEVIYQCKSNENLLTFSPAYCFYFLISLALNHFGNSETDRIQNL